MSHNTWEQHGLSHSPQGYHEQSQTWHWPCMFQPIAHLVPHTPPTPLAAPTWTFPPMVPHQYGDSHSSPPPNLLRNHGQLPPSPACHTAPATDTPRPIQEPSTPTILTPRLSITPERPEEQVRQHLSFESPTEDAHSLPSDAETHPHHKASDIDVDNASSHSSNSGRSSSHKKRRRKKHRRSRDDSSRRKHKRHRRHSSSSSSSSHHRPRPPREHIRPPYPGSHNHTTIRRRRRNNPAPNLTKEERWLTLSHKSGKKSTPPSGGLLCDCIKSVLHKGGFTAIPRLRSISQINITQRPHPSKDRATQWILQFPPMKGAIKARSWAPLLSTHHDGLSPPRKETS